MNLVQAALKSAEPGAAVRSHVRRTGDILEVDGRRYDLTEYRGIFVVGAGKAAGPMAEAIEDILGDRIVAGIICVKYGYTAATTRVEVEQAGHPIPDERAVRATERMIALVESAGQSDLIICLISG
ncbi:MAG TPA: DUF4147 domain-containing protein, partial [Chloroflexota bacterium]|nr:DUF4147 domain-containing protein [Chloroflexota bacterium]